MLDDFAWDNPFNSEAWFQDIDPMYAKTAEDFDRMGFRFLPEIADIETYVDAHWLPTYQNAIGEAVEEGRVCLNRTTAEIPHPSAATVTRCWIKRIEATRKEEAKMGVFNIDAVIVAEIDIFQPKIAYMQSDSVGSYRELLNSGVPLKKGHVRQWYRIRGYIDLIGCENCPVQSISIYDKRDKRQERGLSDCLIPIIPRRDMDVEAERILLKHNMIYAVNCNCRVDPMELANNMGLAVKCVRLSRERRIKGELYLHDATVRYYRADGTEDYMDVKAGTILYDSVACGTQEQIAETIIHECVHFEEHALFFMLQRLYNENLEFLASMDVRYDIDKPEDAYEQWLEDEAAEETDYSKHVSDHGSKQGRQERTAVEWAEWQTRELTPRVMMPAKQTKQKIQWLICLYGNYPHHSTAELYAMVIPELAKFYGVSWTTAKIRMIELGFEEARGARNFVDGVYVPPYTTSAGRFEAGTSYDISKADAERLQKTDPVFEAVIESGQFVYVEGHYCLDDPLFIRRDEDGIRLTDTARQQIDKCCLLFDVRYNCKGSAYDKEAFHSDIRKNDAIAVSLASIPLELMMQASRAVDELCEGLPRRFGKTLEYHRKQMGFSQEEFAELLDVDERQIRRWESEQTKPTQRQIGAMGVLMNLPGQFTEDMMNKAKCPR